MTKGRNSKKSAINCFISRFPEEMPSPAEGRASKICENIEFFVRQALLLRGVPLPYESRASTLPE
jgi:hypothetical protein